MTTRDWGNYGNILNEAASLEEADRAKPEIDCPVCGQLLAVNPAGVKSCPMGHYRSGVAGI